MDETTGVTVEKPEWNNDTQINNTIENSVSSVSLKSEFYEENVSKDSFYEDFDKSKKNIKEIPIIHLPSSIEDNFIFLTWNNYICSNCKEYFYYTFNSDENINVECGCKYIQYCPVNEFIRKYSSLTKPNLCEKHNKGFTNYCKACKKDLCEDCLEVKAKFSNSTGNITAHNCHILIITNVLLINNKYFKKRFLK